VREAVASIVLKGSDKLPGAARLLVRCGSVGASKARGAGQNARWLLGELTSGKRSAQSAKSGMPSFLAGA